MRYTTAPSWYLEPSSQRILRVADREGLTGLTLDEQNFITDLCNAAVGAQVKDFDGRDLAEEATYYAQEKIQVLAKQDPYMANNYSHITRFADEYIGFRRSVHQILKTFDLNQMPGDSLIVKAVRLVMLLRYMRQVNQNHFSSVYRDALNTLLDALDKAEGVSESDRALLDELSGEDETNELSLMLVLELAVKKVDLAEMFRVARHLDQISEIERPRAAPQPHHDGEDVGLRDNRDLGELFKAGLQALSLPRKLMLYRAATSQLTIREPVTRRDKRQLLYFVVDGSCSMQGAPAGRAAGVVLNRLQAVTAGEAELYLRFFDEELRETEYHANSLESASELMGIVTDPFFYLGWDTAFAGPLADASRRVKELVQSGNLVDEEIFLVTDGAAPVPSPATLGGTKLHVIQVGVEEVPSLADLARQSGGINIMIHDAE